MSLCELEETISCDIDYPTSETANSQPYNLHHFVELNEVEYDEETNAKCKEERSKKCESKCDMRCSKSITVNN